MNITNNTSHSPRYLRVFLALPGDVADERGLALAVARTSPLKAWKLWISLLFTATLSRFARKRLEAVDKSPIHGYFVALSTATLSRFALKIHGYFVAQTDI